MRFVDRETREDITLAHIIESQDQVSRLIIKHNYVIHFIWLDGSSKALRIFRLYY